MRPKLQTFTDFANTLLPHETQYLLSVAQLEDEQKRGILERVHKNCLQINQFTPYDTTLDKRKYSNLKNWIQKRLRQIDVDARFAWISELDQQITTDRIQSSDEKKLLRAIRKYEHPTFFFKRFYELVRNYRHFLLIRLRYHDHQLVNSFLEAHEDDYRESCRVDTQMHQATQDIIDQYAANTAESIQWERWLSRVFFDESLDGYYRHMAFVRLTFVSFNYRKFDLLWEKFDYLDSLFACGQSYSKRILLNYYHLRLLLHARVRDFEQAIYYGYLSIRGKTHDYLFYVNNLSAVLLRANRPQEALQVMRNATKEMKETQNFHNKIGFVSFYVKCLIANQLYKNAENYCSTFLKAYEKEVLHYRWHTFFAAYLEALLVQGKYDQMLNLMNRYILAEREGDYRKRADYLPTISWYDAVARYQTGTLPKSALRSLVQSDLEYLRQDENRRAQLDDLLKTIKPIVPEVVNYLPF